MQANGYTSELQAYVMNQNRMTQPQAQAWLDKHCPRWRNAGQGVEVECLGYESEEDE